MPWPAGNSIRILFKLLGLSTVVEYRDWCKSIELSDGLYKSEAQREKEVQIKRRNDFDGSLKKDNVISKDFSRIAKDILSGTIEKDDLTHPGLRHVCWLIRDMGKENERKELFIRLLVAVLPKADFLDLNPVVEHFGKARGNTLIDGLFAITAHPDRWIAAPESFCPVHKNLDKIYHSSLMLKVFGYN